MYLCVRESVRVCLKKKKNLCDHTHGRTHARMYALSHTHLQGYMHARKCTHMHLLLIFKKSDMFVHFVVEFLSKENDKIGHVFKASPDKGTNYEFDQIVWGVFFRKAERESERERTTYPKG